MGALKRFIWLTILILALYDELASENQSGRNAMSAEFASACLKEDIAAVDRQILMDAQLARQLASEEDGYAVNGFFSACVILPNILIF